MTRESSIPSETEVSKTELLAEERGPVWSQKEKLDDLLNEQNLSYTEIAEMYGVKPETVGKVAREHGVNPGRSGQLYEGNTVPLGHSGNKGEPDGYEQYEIPIPVEIMDTYDLQRPEYEETTQRGSLIRYMVDLDPKTGDGIIILDTTPAHEGRDRVFGNERRLSARPTNHHSLARLPQNIVDAAGLNVRGDKETDWGHRGQPRSEDYYTGRDVTLDTESDRIIASFDPGMELTPFPVRFEEPPRVGGGEDVSDTDESRAEMLDALSETAAEIVELRTRNPDQLQREIANEVGVSDAYVSQVLRANQHLIPHQEEKQEGMPLEETTTELHAVRQKPDGWDGGTVPPTPEHILSLRLAFPFAYQEAYDLVTEQDEDPIPAVITFGFVREEVSQFGETEMRHEPALIMEFNQTVEDSEPGVQRSINTDLIGNTSGASNYAQQKEIYTDDPAATGLTEQAYCHPGKALLNSIGIALGEPDEEVSRAVRLTPGRGKIAIRPAEPYSTHTVPE